MIEQPRPPTTKQTEDEGGSRERVREEIARLREDMAAIRGVLERLRQQLDHQRK